MGSSTNGIFSRRQVMQAGVAAGVALAARGSPAADAKAADAKTLPLILKTIPSTGEQLPAVGVGTNAFGFGSDAQMAELKQVLQGLTDMGGKVVDTARVYGDSELVIGKLLAEIGNRDKVFLATKLPMGGGGFGGGGFRGFAGGGGGGDAKSVLDESFRRLQVSKLDLLQLHNVGGVREYLPAMQEYKQAGKIRYLGVTTSVDDQYGELIDVLKNNKFDFVQVDYSIGNRDAAPQVLPFAQDKGLAVLINQPFGGRGKSYFGRLAGKPVPEWAAEFDATTWAQFMLKYIISHPAVTAAIPGTTTMAYLQDNQAGGRGRLPTPAQRKKMEEYWDALPS
ncbi:MAG TPA: aldo/keto reductase [Steroidobacteraceae bacterium]|nr:aldo/keto reductase [Steroidobacteraceae bacterium]